MATDLRNLLTEEQKEAFRKGDAYYVSPFKHMKVRIKLNTFSPAPTAYATISFTQIYAAVADKRRSQKWN